MKKMNIIDENVNPDLAHALIPVLLGNDGRTCTPASKL